MANSLIDFGIVQPEAAGAFLRGFQGAQAQQQQNQLAALQLRAAQRGEEEALAEREAAKGATSFQDLAQRYQQAGLTKQALGLQKQVDEQTAAKLKQATEVHKLVSDSLRGVAALGTRESAQGALANAKAKGLDVSQYEAELAQVPDAQIRQWALSHAAGADKALEQQFVDLGIGTAAGPKYAIGGNPPALPVPQPQPVVAPTAPSVGMPTGIPGKTPPTRAGTNALALPAPGGMGGAMPSAQPYAVPGGGVMYPKSMTLAQQAAEARAQRQLQLSEQAADPEFQQKMAAAKQAGALAAKSSVEAQKTLPKVISQAEEGIRLIDEMVGKRDEKGQLIKGSSPHPGFETAVGAGLPLRFIPGTNAADFQTRFDQIKGASFLAAFESLKGGGSITEKEGQKATSAINRMSLAQSEKEFVTAARDLQNILQSGIKDAQRRLQNVSASIAAPLTAVPAAGKAKFLGFE